MPSIEEIASCLYDGKVSWLEITDKYGEDMTKTLKMLKAQANPNFYFHKQAGMHTSPKEIKKSKHSKTLGKQLTDTFDYYNVSDIFWQNLNPLGSDKGDSISRLFVSEVSYIRKILHQHLYHHYKYIVLPQKNQITDFILKRERTKIAGAMTPAIAFSFLKIAAEWSDDDAHGSCDMKRLKQKMIKQFGNDQHVHTIFVDYPSNSAIWKEYYNLILKKALRIFLDDIVHTHKNILLLQQDFQHSSNTLPHHRGIKPAFKGGDFSIV
ncbi:hypothetical protein RFF05_12525 [Bengtsoniella intestinalis]|uniref:hypothetical protein n=1 Tax=Bengtsoniella intestinalis TaxID=3073143 RepID=UPI00391FA8E9